MAARRPAQLELPVASVRTDAPIRGTLLLAGSPIDYTLKRSRRRRATSFAIDERGLRVAAPWSASQQRIEALLLEHAGWISRKLAQWEARRPPALTWETGSVLRIVGDPVQLVLCPANGRTERQGDQLYVASDSPEASAVAKHVIAWLRAMAMSWFERRAADYAPALGVRMPLIRLSNARTRWGCCYPTGRVHLNWRLIQTPSELIDYVVVHELAHLREPNHSQRFWRHVAEVLPDYEQRRRALRTEAHRYLLA